MKATQGHVSAPMLKFDWLKSFQLDVYHNKKAPLLVFGCYKKKDFQIIERHKGPVIIIWMGSDSEKFIHRRFPREVIHVTWIKAIHDLFIKQRVPCILTKLPVKEIPRPVPNVLGSKVYAYIQRGKPWYHGVETVNSLTLKHELLIGDHSVNQQAWYNGVQNRYYNQAFVGLALSAYAGGGMSIMEMGVRGIKVVTNVLKLPHCIPWETKEDIEKAVLEESKKIGTIDHELVAEVYKHMVEIKGEFDLTKMI